MEAGDKFSTEKYDIVAQAGILEGGGPPNQHTVAVLSNNSSHYLVVWLHEEQATLIASIPYSNMDDEEGDHGYRMGLWLMTKIALEN